MKQYIRLALWTVIFLLVALPGYISLIHLADKNGFEGWKAYIWPYCYIWLVGMVVIKVKATIEPMIIIKVKDMIVPVLQSLPLPKLRYPPLFNYPVIDRVKTIETQHGIIYIMRRSDGILKFGKTQNLRRRFKNHCKDYEQGFGLVTSWIVPDLEKYEKDILRMSEDYHYSEGARLELRQMAEDQLTELIFVFTDKVHRGWVQ